MTFSDSRISKFLQEHFIVQWEAVSPVRLVKFDLGEGRSFSGTVNGEIAIYFCDSNGKVFDILPALQSPAITLNRIKEAKAFFTQNAGKQSKQAIKEDLQINNLSGLFHQTEEEIEKLVNKQYKFQIQPGQISQSSINKLHRDRLKKVASERYQSLTDKGVQVFKNPENIPASLVFPDTKKGEEKRDAYIYAALDDATRDLRFMVMSKIGPPPTHFDNSVLAAESLTIVEPGGLGYYQWQIDRAFFGAIDPPGTDSMLLSDIFDTQPDTPQEWKEIIFTSIMKQELKGGVIEYNSESLDAIQVIE